MAKSGTKKRKTDGSSEMIPAAIQKELYALIDRLELKTIRLESIQSGRSLPINGNHGDINISSGGEVEERGGNKWLVYLFQYEVAMELKPDESSPNRRFFHIEAVFRVVYRIKKEPFEIEPGQIEQFGRLVACANVWPFWRELVQSITSRMNLPPLTLPLITPSQLQR